MSVDEVVHRALIGIPMGRIRDSIPDDLPLIDTDAGLLERVIANITANAVRHSPDGATVRLLAGEISDEQGRRVQIRVADSGPGCRRTIGRRCSRRSSGWATCRMGPVSAWDWRSPAGWPRRWTPPSRSRTPRAAG